MAETYIVGPLVSMGVYLGRWACKKWREHEKDKQHDSEARAFIASVNALANFVLEKAEVIKQLQQEVGIRTASLGCSML